MSSEALLEYVNDSPDDPEQILANMLKSPELLVTYLENDNPVGATPARAALLQKNLQACREHKCSNFDGFVSTRPGGRYKHTVFVNLDAEPAVGFYNKPSSSALLWVGLGVASIAIGYLLSQNRKKR
jgi:hypothetical protein